MLFASIPAVVPGTAPTFSLDTWAEQTLEHIRGEGLYIDGSRNLIVRDVARNLVRLVQGNLVRHDGYCRLLLGRKGVGKTVLVAALRAAAKALLGPLGLVTCHVSGASLPVTLPFARMWHMFQGLCAEVHPGDGSEDEVEHLAQAAATLGVRVFLTVDEVDLLFRSVDPNAKIALMQLVALSSSHAGRFLCVMTGSGSEVRRLCFARLPCGEATRGEYPAYTKIDMNSTKFTPMWLDPFLGARDFAGAARAIDAAAYATMGPAQQAEFYVAAGGNARAMGKILRGDSVDQYAGTCRGLPPASPQWKLLEWVQHRAEEWDRASASEPGTGEEPVLSRLERWTTTFVLGPEGPQLPDPDLYDLADDGLIRFENMTSALPARRAGLGHPMMYLQLGAVHSGGALTTLERLAMLFPNVLGEVAETAMLKLLAPCAQDVFGVVGISPTYDGLPCPSGPGTLASAIVGRVWKEAIARERDALGGDGCFIPLRKEGAPFVVHRVQIKLGQGSANEQHQRQWMKDAVARFKTMEETAQMHYETLLRGPVAQVWWMVTTRQHHAELVGELCVPNRVRFVGMRELRRAGVNLPKTVAPIPPSSSCK